MNWAVSDVHGFRSELRDALIASGILDGAGHWVAGTASLWFLGDYVDRGPDGLGVVDDIRRMQSEAADSGGSVIALLGNHEIQFLAAHRFATTPVPALAPYRDWLEGWSAFGGRAEELAAVDPDQLGWLRSLPAVALTGSTLLVHSDTDRYLELGPTIEQINARAASVLASNDLDAWVWLCDVLSDRGRLRSDSRAVDNLLESLHSRRLIHGHSTLTKHFADVAEPGQPFEYAGGRVMAIDGGAYDSGALIVAPFVPGEDVR